MKAARTLTGWMGQTVGGTLACIVALALSAAPVAAAPAAKDQKAQAKPAATKTVAHAKPAPAKATAPAKLVTSASKTTALKASKVAYVPRSYGISCVPYARAVTGMGIKGNAKDWWDNAAGTYARGQAPESGAVMSFQGTRGMTLGHVAVVTRVLDSRTVEIDHANWRGPGALKGGVFKSIPLRDVSPNNDWTAVRVGLGHSGDFGNTVYPTNGFIYDRPDRGSMLASARAPEPQATPARWREAEAIVRQVR